MTSGRSILAEALRGALGWLILADARQLDSVPQPGACVLWTERRTKAPTLGLHWFKDEITLLVLTATEDPTKLEDNLDQLLLEVAHALEPLESFTWETAQRVSLKDTFPGYQIAITCFVQVVPNPEPDTEE